MKLKTAYKLAIDAITMEQKKYYPGHFEYERSGIMFDFAEKDHKKWTRLETAKNKMVVQMHRTEQDSRQIGLFVPVDSESAEV